MSLLILILSVIYFFETGNCIPEVLVINGNNTEISKYPFMVSIRNPNEYIICGGTIIAQSWVLSVTHCVMHYMNSLNETTVEYGAAIIADKGGKHVAVKQIIMHEGFSASNPASPDIALLELKDPLIYDYTTIAPVTLPEPYFEIPQNENYVPGVLVGWSRHYSYSVLQEVDSKIYSKKICKKKYPHWDTTNKLCAGVMVNSSWCFGPGEPLLYKGSLQLGIRSLTTSPCAQSNHAAIYAEVSHYIQWINSFIYN